MKFINLDDPDFAELDSSLLEDIKYSVLEGSLGTAMTTLVGGAFLIGFALVLGADNSVIGILASLPLLANLIQIIGSYIISKAGDSKRVCLFNIFIHRLLWLFIVLLPFFIFRDSFYDIRVWIFVALLGVSSIFASLTNVSWTSWMADLIPRNIRGRFFAKRNIVAQIVGMLLAVMAGRFLDVWRGIFPDPVNQSYGFVILFAVGTLFGFIGITILKKMHRAPPKPASAQNFFSQLTKPLKDSAFRYFILFSVAWGFSVGIAGPFFSVYMIQNLQIPFSIITLFGVVAGISSIFGMRIVGRVIDRLGPKPLFILCGCGAALLPSLWLLATPENYHIIWVINIVSGFCWAGIGIISSSLMMNMAPSEYNSVYFAVFAGITGLSGALAPIVGGYLGEYFSGIVINLGFFQVSNLKILFLLSAVCRLCSLLFLNLVQIKDNASVREVYANFAAWQRNVPLNAYFSITGYVGNVNLVMNRGVVIVRRNAERALATGRKMGRHINGRRKKKSVKDRSSEESNDLQQDIPKEIEEQSKEGKDGKNKEEQE